MLHVRQELNTESEETSVLQAVLEADVERQMLLDEEKLLLSKLEGDGGGGSGDQDSQAKTSAAETVEEKQKRLLSETKQQDGNDAFNDDLKRLKEVYERLQLLSADTAKSRAAMILSGLQFTTEMQMAPIKSLSGGWRMRVALAASLLIEPDLLLLGTFGCEPMFLFLLPR